MSRDWAFSRQSALSVRFSRYSHIFAIYIRHIYLGRRFDFTGKAFALLLQDGIVADVRILMKNIRSVDKVEDFGR